MLARHLTVLCTVAANRDLQTDDEIRDAIIAGLMQHSYPQTNVSSEVIESVRALRRMVLCLARPA